MNIDLFNENKELNQKLIQENKEEIVENNENKDNIENILFYSIFLFVNPTSGGNKAADFTNLQTETIKFFSLKREDEYEDSETELYIYNLKDKKNKERGFNKLKRKIEKNKAIIRVIVCGGDGTVMWVVEELIKNEIDLNKCPIGILPFGTGNDFSRSLGWGGEAPNVIIGKNLDYLKFLTKKWMKASIQEFDIWDITFYTNKNGCFKKAIKINEKSQKEIITEEKEGKIIPIKEFKKKMSNYFSVGIDARIGLGFEQHRTTYRFCNLLVYCFEGFKKLFVKTRRVNSVIEDLEIINEQDDKISHFDIKIEDMQAKRDILFTTKSVFKEEEIVQENEEKKKKKFPKIKGNPASLLCLNINSYMGGASDAWGSSTGQIGVNKESGINFETQNFNDGKLEFLTFSSSLKLASERIFKGQAQRVGQGSGPFILNFKKSEDDFLPIKTYFQIDGEFFEVIQPDYCKIESCKEVKNGKIKVLVDINKN